ncbi:HEAT repeat domain-containing protein [Streptomyces sp. CA-111067]|uniref:HEAT repeat domain-containing protein n=1 Tax=Streptomyces sp. CA-111067 TaxID=3240046 RepID=UPI003D98C950
MAEEDLVSASSAIHLLADLGGPTATEIMLRVLEDPDGFLHHGSDPLTFAAVQGVGRLHEHRAVPALIALVNKDLRIPGYMADAACEALGEIGDPQAIPTLLASAANRNTLGDKPGGGAAIKALARFEPNIAVPLLLAHLWDYVSDRRAHIAVRELGRIGSPAALPALTYLILNANRQHALRRTAAQALARLTDVSDIDYRLRSVLGSPDPWTARAVAETFARSERGREWLAQDVQHGDPLVRQAACHGLAGTKDPQFVPVLGETLRKDRSAVVRRAAATALRDLGGAPDMLLSALGDPRVSDIIVDALIASTDPPVTELLALLEHGEPGQQRDAARSLGRIGESQASATLVAMLPETDGQLRAAVVEALGALRHEPALPDLMAIAADTEEIGTVRAQAVLAVGACGNRDLPLRALHDPEEAIRVRAAEALGDFPDSEVAAALSATVGEDTRDVQRAALEALGKHGPSAENVLFDVLGRAQDDIRGHAARQLPQCATTAGIPRLVSLALDEDRAVSLAAITTLAGLDDPLIIAPLTGVVSRELPNPSWGRADPRHVIATKALARFDDEHAVTAIADKSLLVCMNEAREALTAIAERR